MNAGVLLVPSTANPFVPLGYVASGRSNTSLRLVIVGGLLVLHQTFNGAVARSSRFVAKSAFVGTLTRDQVMLFDVISVSRRKFT